MKNRKQKFLEYEEKYHHIPKTNKERLSWLYDELKLSIDDGIDIINKRDSMLNSLSYRNEIKIVLYEEPEGSPRPRFRLVNRYNFSNLALENSNFVHVYSITGKEDNVYMKRLLNTQEFSDIQGLIYTPCDIEYCVYLKTPTAFNRIDTYLAELGLIRPITKPDWDNIGKKYSDMYNGNVWLDDTLVIDATVRKYYSVLPRVEITLKYLNMLYNKYQFNSIKNKPELQDMQLKYFGGDNNDF